MNQNELMHYGILGMKWGVRRYQNKDGTRTSEGKRRERRMSEDASEAKRIKKKKVSQMSNAELRKLNERQQLERTHNQLNKGAVAKGVAFLAASAGVMNTVLNVYNNSDKLVKAGKKVADKFLKNN